MKFSKYNEFVSEGKLNEAAEKYITDEFKVGDTIKLLKYDWKVVEVNFKPGKSYKDSFTFFDGKQVSIKSPPTNKNAVGYKIEDGRDSAFLHYYKASSGKTIMKLAIKGFNESVNEARASAVGLLKDVVKGSTSSVEGIKLSKDMAQAYLDWISGSTYGKKFGALPWNKLFDASFNWGIERYAKGKLKGELKELKAKAKEMSESVNEELSPEIYSAIATVKTEKDGPKLKKAMATILNAAKAKTGHAEHTLEQALQALNISDSKLNEGKITRKFQKAAEALQKIQLEMQTIVKQFVKEVNPTKKGKLKEQLRELTAQKKEAELDFNSALATEPIDLEESADWVTIKILP
jgi:hypothetical protein